MYNEPYSNAGQPQGALSAVFEQPSAREQLVKQKEALTAQLKRVDDAIQALNDHPDVEKVLTLVGRTVRF